MQEGEYEEYEDFDLLPEASLRPPAIAPRAMRSTRNDLVIFVSMMVPASQENLEKL